MADLYKELGDLALPAQALGAQQQERILEQALRRCTGEKRRPRRWKWRAAVLAAALCCLCAGSVAAAARLLSPGQAAQQMQEEALAALFTGDDAICLEQTQKAGDYIVTLLGLTRGENATAYWSSDWRGESPSPDRSYAVLAVEKRDGSPMAPLDAEQPDITLSNSIVSPLLAAPDCPLMDYNVFTMNGARCDIVSDGVLYILVQTDDLQPFADKDPKLAVVLQNGGIEALLGGFTQDAATGAITPRADQQDTCLLFDLPLDESKADPQKAAALREQWLGSGEKSIAEGVNPEEEALGVETKPTPEQVRAEGTLLESQTVSITEGPYGNGWYYGDGGFITSANGWDWPEEVEVIGWSDDGWVAMLTHHPDDTLTVEQWRLPMD